MTKVCMISCLHNPYDDRIYWKESVSLTRDGYDVTHVAVSDRSAQCLSDEGVRIVELPRKTYFKSVLLDKVYRTFFFKSEIYNDILRTALELNADVYHLHDYQLLRIVKKIKEIKPGAKIIFDAHEPFPITIRYSPSPSKLLGLLKRFHAFEINLALQKKSTLFDLIIVTEENAFKYYSQLVGQEKVSVIYNFTDLRLTERKEKKYDLIYAGVIRSTRGVFQTLEALNQLKQQYNVLAKTLFLGPVHERKLKKKIEDTIKEYGLGNTVEMKSTVPYKQVHEYYQKSRIGLAIFNDNPINRQILPIKIFEYMAMGLPVITSDFGHMMHYTKKNDTGITVNPAFPNDIAKAINRLLSDSSEIQRMSENGVKAAKQYYNWGIMEKKLVGLYRKITA